MMPDTPLVQKLFIKSGYHIAVVNAPDGYLDKLGALPEGVRVSKALNTTYDFVQLFVKDKADLERQAPVALKAVKPGGLLWISYPKKTSKIKTDISRDVGWEVVTTTGWQGVTLISIDEVWSAMRFKPMH